MEDANLHGGWLTAWGRPGMGAQFRLTLPRKAGAILETSPLPMVPRDLVGPDGVRLDAWQGRRTAQSVDLPATEQAPHSFPSAAEQPAGDSSIGSTATVVGPGVDDATQPAGGRR
jgi:two-component system sensor histidine kinase MtrB